MIVTDRFVYIHVSRTAGTFLNKLILDHMPGARLLQYHGHLRDLPAEYQHLPVIGFVRNPWDWYVSMYFDYRRKQQYVFNILSQRGALGFEETIAGFLNLGDKSARSKEMLDRLTSTAPKVINANTPPRRRNPGLRAEYFENYPQGHGYYSWLFQHMFETENGQTIHIGRFENLREEALRLFEETGAPISKSVTKYLKEAEPQNAGPRPKSFLGGYSPELEKLVAEKECFLIDKFGYEFSEADKYPKTDFFNNMGAVEVDALIHRVKNIPESQWKVEDAEKPNKLNKLNDTRHVIFRYIDDHQHPFDFHDFPNWEDWRDDLLPIMKAVAERIGYKDYRFPRVMLARLPAGGEISPHIDGKASSYVHKIHVPLITNAETEFHVGGQAKVLPAGEAVEVNNKRMHAVYNRGEQDRVHLIFECYSMDDYGKSD